MSFPALILGSDDSELIDRIRRRDPQAMGAFYDRYGPSAYAVILRIVNDPSVAQDVLAETFIKAWNRLGTLKSHRRFELGVWILCLARNSALELSRPAKAPNWSALESLPLFQDAQHDLDATRWRALEASFSDLTDFERQTLEVACFDGLSPDEMPVRLERPLSQIRSWINSALAKLSTAR